MARRFLALALALGLALPVAAHAQAPFRIGLALGPSFPGGDLSDNQEWGYHFTGFIAGRPALSPIGLRGEVMYQSFTGKDIDTPLGDIEAEDASLLAGIVNVEAGMSGVGLRPYFVGGIGMYRFDNGSDDAETKFGLNGGLGIDFGLAGFSAFAEARYHKVFVDEDADGDKLNLSFIPISFGIRF